MEGTFVCLPGEGLGQVTKGRSTALKQSKAKVGHTGCDPSKMA